MQKHTPHQARRFQIHTLLFLLFSLIGAFMALPAKAQDQQVRYIHPDDEGTVAFRYGKTVIYRNIVIQPGSSYTFKHEANSYIRYVENGGGVNLLTVTDDKGKTHKYKNFDRVFIFDSTEQFKDGYVAKKLVYAGTKPIRVKYFTLPTNSEQLRLQNKQPISPYRLRNLPPVKKY